MADITYIFKEKLKDLIRTANEQGMCLSADQIHEAMAQSGLGKNDDHFRMVCDYLDQMGIRITDPDFQEAGEEGGELRRGIERYLEELDELEEIREDEELDLFHRAAMKDEAATGRLIELYLQTACDLAGEYETILREGGKEHGRKGERLTEAFGAGSGSGKSAFHVSLEMDTEDLLQEANMALVLAVNDLEKEESLAAYRARLLNKLSSFLEESLKAEEASRETDIRILSRMNQLADTAKLLEEDYGRKPSVQELSAYLGIPQEKIEDLLRIGGEKLTDQGGGQEG